MKTLGLLLSSRLREAFFPTSINSLVRRSFSTPNIVAISSRRKREQVKYGYYFSEHKPNTGYAKLLGASVIAVAMSTFNIFASCEHVGNQNIRGIGEVEESISPNPLWPRGVSDEAVRLYVEAILANPDINIKCIPDVFERAIYTSVIKLTLNLVYKTLSNIHEIEFLGHALQISVTKEPGDFDLTTGFSCVDRTILEAQVDKLLSDRAVNMKRLPDSVVAETLTFRICGHQLKISFEKLVEEERLEILEKIVTDTKIDRITVDERLIELSVEEALNDLPSTDSFWMMLPLSNQVLKDLHVAVYSLVVGLIDNFIDNTNISVLGEQIKCRVVPLKESEFSRLSDTAENSSKEFVCKEAQTEDSWTKLVDDLKRAKRERNFAILTVIILAMYIGLQK